MVGIFHVRIPEWRAIVLSATVACVAVGGCGRSGESTDAQSSADAVVATDEVALNETGQAAVPDVASTEAWSDEDAGAVDLASTVTVPFACGPLTCQPGTYCYEQSWGYSLSVDSADECTSTNEADGIWGTACEASVACWKVPICCDCADVKCLPFPVGCRSCGCLPSYDYCVESTENPQTCTLRADGSLDVFCAGY